MEIVRLEIMLLFMFLQCQPKPQDRKLFYTLEKFDFNQRIVVHLHLHSRVATINM